MQSCADCKDWFVYDTALFIAASEFTRTCLLLRGPFNEKVMRGQVIKQYLYIIMNTVYDNPWFYFQTSNMPHMGPRKAMLILLFGLVMPTIDQYADINIVLRLMAGPDPDTHVNSG